uniref:Uncharacterized protein n=1 Tax=Amphimedon queenslandica TaxID=400682 RepID=A0A1X7T9Z3_AMPQE
VNDGYQAWTRFDSITVQHRRPSLLNRGCCSGLDQYLFQSRCSHS